MLKIFASVILIVYIAAITALSYGQAPTPGDLITAQAAASDAFVIRRARIFDGKKIISADSVFVRNGKIQAIGKNLRVPTGTAEIDAAGDTLLPGLIDSHTHDWGDSPKQALLFGVTTELNMGGIPKFAADLKQAEAEGKQTDFASLLSAGNVVTPPKGHGTEYGMTVPTLTSASDAQTFVDARLAEGSDYIKIIDEDGHVCHYTFSKLSPEELAAAIAAAHKRGKMAVVHISSQDDARAAISAGADGIAHLFADSAPQPDFARFVHRHHAFVATTLTAIQTSLGSVSGKSLIADDRLAKYLSPDTRSHMQEPLPALCSGKLENAFALAKQLHDAGVPVLAGTDAPAPGSSNGISLHGELELLVRAGFSPSAALAAATSLPASVFHLNDRGRIAPGLRADLLLVRGNPTQDITATRNIVAVWKLGIQDDRVIASSGHLQAEAEGKSALQADTKS
jgi:imidazolonepropionase-like amidohydrolase